MAQPTTDSPPTRRGFFGLLTWLVGGLATLAFVCPFVLYLLGPLRKKKKVDWVRLGPVATFQHENETRWTTFANPLGQPWDGMTASTGVYVRYLGKEGTKPQFWVFAANCAHLGCPVSWFPQSGLFMCPCHGGVYYENGERASGPPPRGLFKCIWRVEKNNLEIQAPHLPTLQDPLDEKAKV